jgi:hypothetical protein
MGATMNDSDNASDDTETECPGSHEHPAFIDDDMGAVICRVCRRGYWMTDEFLPYPHPAQ